LSRWVDETEANSGGTEMAQTLIAPEFGFEG